MNGNEPGLSTLEWIVGPLIALILFIGGLIVNAFNKLSRNEDLIQINSDEISLLKEEQEKIKAKLSDTITRQDLNESVNLINDKIELKFAKLDSRLDILDNRIFTLINKDHS